MLAEDNHSMGLTWFDWGTGIGMPCNLVITTHLHLLPLIIIRCQPAVENITMVHRWSAFWVLDAPLGLFCKLAKRECRIRFESVQCISFPSMDMGPSLALERGWKRLIWFSMGFSMVSWTASWCYSIFKSWDVLGHCPACCRWHIDSAHRAAVCDQSPISAQTHSPQRSQSSGTSKPKTLPKPRASFWTQQLNSFHCHFLNFWDACQLSHSTSWLSTNAMKI